jgi:phosphate transport system substrate-binding protein
VLIFGQRFVTRAFIWCSRRPYTVGLMRAKESGLARKWPEKGPLPEPSVPMTSHQSFENDLAESKGDTCSMTTPLTRAGRRQGGQPRRLLAIAASSLIASAALAATSGGAASALTAYRTAARAHASVQLTEDGSSLLYPLYVQWAKGYAKSHHGFSSTSGADGSGAGISDAENGTTDFGASDAYLPPGTNKQYPTLENIPTAISAQMINYNIPGMSKVHLKLNGQIIARMYEGKITYWNSKAIKKLNPKVRLPHLKVVTVHRSDSSGDSFLFTSYLAFSDKQSFAGQQGPSTAPSFPAVPGAIAAKGNSGMVAACAQAKGCIAYIGNSYHKDITADGLGIAALENKSHNFELPNLKGVEAEAAGFPKVPANGAISLIYGKAKYGYPIINYEYIIVKKNQPSTALASTERSFLYWCINHKDGNSTHYLDAVLFKPLPNAAEKVAHNLISKIH